MSSKFNEALAETNIADYNYLAKLEQISNQARSIRGKDLTLKRPVTEEMVKEYQKQFNTPVVVQEKDEFGNPVEKQYKYIKPSMTDTLEEYKPVEPELDDFDIDYIKNQTEQLVKYINDKSPLISEFEEYVNSGINENKNLINEIDEEIAQLREEYNSIIVEPYAKKKSKKHTQKDKLMNKINKLTTDINQLETENKDLPNDLNLEKSMIEDVNNRIKHNSETLREDEIAKELNQSEKKRIERLNKEKIRNYQEQLNMLNRRAFNMTQDPGETEEKYLKRLEDIASTPYIDEDYNQAIIHNIQNIQEKNERCKYK
jgi:chromosome segregation ATPase